MADRKMIYHRADGAIEVWGVDAAQALRFPKEWKDEPWTDEDIAAADKADAPEMPADASGKKPKSS